MVALLVVLTILVFLTLDYFVQRAALRDAAAANVPAGVPALARAAGPARLIPDPLPEGMLFDSAHTWLRQAAGGTFLVGADALPGMLLGEVTDVDLAKPGVTVRRGEPIATLAGGNHTLTLRAPVDGKISEVNPEVALDPSRVVSEPFGSGWLVRIEAKEPQSILSRLVQGEAAANWARRELARLREFLSPADARVLAPVGATLHDGGEPLSGMADRLDREAWQGLETAFFLPAPEEPDRLSERFVDPYSLGDAR